MVQIIFFPPIPDSAHQPIEETLNLNSNNYICTKINYTLFQITIQ